MTDNKENNIPEELTPQYEKLLADGYNESNAAAIVGEMWEVVDNLHKQLKEFGYEDSEIESLCKIKLLNYIHNMECREIPFGLIKPLSFMNKAAKEVYGDSVSGWFALSEDERNDIGWRIGYNTKMYKLYVDVGCYSDKDNRECGIFIYGSERTDKAWRNARGNEGQWLCSDEVKYIDERDTLAGFRNNMDWDNIAARGVKKNIDKGCQEL